MSRLDSNRGPGPNQPQALPRPLQPGPRALPAPDPDAGEEAAGSRPAALSAAPDALGLLRALRRRWLLALVLGLVAGPAGAALGWYLLPSVMPAKNVARTTLFVAAKQPVILASAASDSKLDFATYQRSQIALVKSRLVLNAALRSAKVAELDVVRQQSNPSQWLEAQIKADYTIAPEILSISMTGTSRDELVTIVEAVREAYLQEIVNREQTEANQRLERLKTFYTAKDEILRRKRQALREQAQLIGSGDAQTLARTQQYVIERLATAQRELTQMRSDLRKAQVAAAADQAKEKASDDLVVPDTVVEEQLKKDPVVEQQRQEITRLEGEIEKVRGVLKNPNDPILGRYLTSLDTAKKTLEARREHVRPLIIEQLRERARYDAQVGALQRQEKIGLLQELEKELHKEVKLLEEETDRIKRGSVSIEALREDIAQEEETAKKIGAQVQALTVELSAPARVTLLESATVTESADQRLKVAGGAGFGALLLAVLGVALCEFQARRVSGGQEVVEGLGIRLVGAIPTLRGRRAAADRAPGQPPLPARSLLTESIDVTRSMLVRAAQADGLRVVMVTSALQGEGKTSLSSQLAVSLARAGFRTLLLDGDLRRPSLHRLFETDAKPGLNEVLRNEVGVTAVVRPTKLERLWLVPAGRWDAGSTQALAQDGMKDLLAQLVGQYDFILVDSSPVLPVVDALLIGQHVDAVIFSVLRDVSRLPSLYAAYERVTAFGIRTLGAVINGAREGVYEGTYQANELAVK